MSRQESGLSAGPSSRETNLPRSTNLLTPLLIPSASNAAQQLPQHPPAKQQTTLTQQFLAASGASITAAVVVNPLDVVKTRLQTQAAALQSVKQLPNPSADKWSMFSCPPSCLRASGSSQGLCGAQCQTYNTTLGMLQRIIRSEGYPALWKGTGTSVLMAVPLVGIYMPLYDNILAVGRREGLGEVAAPLLAGCVSRAVSVLCVGPLELLRTRQQAQAGAPSPAAPALALEGGAARAQAAIAGSAEWRLGFTESLSVRSLWRGTSATLLRDVPFSAIYWTAVEASRGAFRDLLGDSSPSTTGQLLAVNMAAGTVSGALAAAVTTPLDVVKTRMQTSPLQRARGMLDTMAEIYAGGGLRAFSTGLGPRVVRAAPACAIVISSYEVLKAAMVHI